MADLRNLDLECKREEFTPGSKEQVDYIISELSEGKQIIIPSHTSGGAKHWITLLDYNPETGEVFVSDSAESSGWYNINNIKNRFQRSVIPVWKD